MRALLGGEWVEGYLDYHRAPGEHRIQVLAWKNLEPLRDVYFARSPSLRLLWNYVREVGVRGVLRKVASRNRERYRNEKYVSCGVGWILEPAGGEAGARGRRVAFLAPLHPPCVERITLPAELVVPLSEDAVALPAEPNTLLYLPVEPGSTEAVWWRGLRGWNRYSGASISKALAHRVLDSVVASLRSADWTSARRLPIPASTKAEEASLPEAPRQASSRPRSVLFGYGHYAKTIILPNVAPFLSVQCIHEVDPIQIPRKREGGIRWDTSAGLREEEAYDVVLIAGFHHTHTPLATAALRNGAYAVVEKPLAVDRLQHRDLLTAVERSPKLFACFHKRYQVFNPWVFQDLRVRPGEAVSYHCIVYEVPLPELHWYRWPNSQSRLVSNGCHWLDHFLYLNEFSGVASSELAVVSDGTLNCSVALENGAFFTMVLTDQGSERIGVQDYVELRANGATVRMVNGGAYTAEGRDRILRRARQNKMHSYAQMYREIGRRIRAGAPGDSPRSVEVSTELVLTLEEKLQALQAPAMVHPYEAARLEEPARAPAGGRIKLATGKESK